MESDAGGATADGEWRGMGTIDEHHCHHKSADVTSTKHIQLLDINLRERDLALCRVTVSTSEGLVGNKVFIRFPFNLSGDCTRSRE